MLGTCPGVLDITAQVFAGFMVLKVYIYICKLGNKISVYISLTIVFFFILLLRKITGTDAFETLGNLLTMLY